MLHTLWYSSESIVNIGFLNLVVRRTLKNKLKNATGNIGASKKCRASHQVTNPACLPDCGNAVDL